MVERVELFGSFKDPNREAVGDVDARVLFKRGSEGDELVRHCFAAAHRADDDGRCFKTHVDRLGFPEFEFQRLLRGRSPRLDIQFARDHESPLPDGVVTQVVCSRSPEPDHETQARTG